MNIVDSVRRGLCCLHDTPTDFWPDSWLLNGKIFWQWLQGALHIHFWVGNDGVWEFEEIKRLDGEILPGGGKKVPGNRYFVIPSERFVILCRNGEAVTFNNRKACFPVLLLASTVTLICNFRVLRRINEVRGSHFKWCRFGELSRYSHQWEVALQQSA